MKHFTYVIYFFVCILANTAAKAGQNFSKQHDTQTSTIDINDTVVFDISQSQIAGNKVSFPVYIITDDTINALDFSFQYDEMNFSLDAIIDLTTYMQSTYNYNSGTVYFTSYSLQEIDHNTNLLSISLNMLGHYLCSDDLDSLLVYLNGDPCSVKVVECLSDAVPEKDQLNLQVFPNPATDVLSITCKENAHLELIDVKGVVVFSGINNSANSSCTIDVSHLNKGMYVLSVLENEKVSYEKVVVE